MNTISRTLVGLSLAFSLIPVAASAYDYSIDPYTHYYGVPTCSITVSNYNQGQYGYDRSVTLTWTSQNTERASISGIGSVGQNGAMVVTVSSLAPSYTMTVANSYTVSTCSTVGNYGTYNGNYGQYPYNQYNQNYQNGWNQYPYVPISQIPYTGFDFGTLGTVIYWTVLASFIIALSYLAVYLRGQAKLMRAN